MYMNILKIQIMWKEIAIIFFLLFVIRELIALYILIAYRKIVKRFYSNEWAGLKRKIQKLQNLCGLFSAGPFNKKMRLIYNSLSFALASMALIENNDSEFIFQLTYIRDYREFEMNSFALALYYYSKHDEEKANENYCRYKESSHENENIKVIMDHLFDDGSAQTPEAIDKAVNSFQNPAIMKLLKDVGLK